MTEQKFIHPSTFNAAQTAIEQAVRDRRVLIVTRDWFEARSVVQALRVAVEPVADLLTIKSSMASGRCYIAASRTGRDELWRVDVCVAGPSLQGRSADTLMISTRLHDGERWTHGNQDELVLATSGSPVILAW